MHQAGYAAKGGQIIDATIIPVPIQRNSRAGNNQIKQGESPPEWEKTPHKRSQKDIDARWPKTNGKSYYGDKDPINIDGEYGFIRQPSVTDAAVHDAQELDIILDPDNADDEVWGDSAYRSQEIEDNLAIEEDESHIHEKAVRNSPLRDEQKASNREQSKPRARVEHVFGLWVTSMGERWFAGLVSNG